MLRVFVIVALLVFVGGREVRAAEPAVYVDGSNLLNVNFHIVPEVLSWFVNTMGANEGNRLLTVHTDADASFALQHVLVHAMELEPNAHAYITLRGESTVNNITIRENASLTLISEDGGTLYTTVTGAFPNAVSFSHTIADGRITAAVITYLRNPPAFQWYKKYGADFIMQTGADGTVFYIPDDLPYGRHYYVLKVSIAGVVVVSDVMVVELVADEPPPPNKPQKPEPTPTPAPMPAPSPVPTPIPIPTPTPSPEPSPPEPDEAQPVGVTDRLPSPTPRRRERPAPITYTEEPPEIPAPVPIPPFSPGVRTIELPGYFPPDINHHRIIAVYEGRPLGGSFDPLTGIFTFELESPYDFIVIYAENLLRLVVQLDSYDIIDLAGNAEAVLMDVQPVIADSRTLLPIRFIAYILGTAVCWNAETREVTLSRDSDGVNLTFAIGETLPGMDVPAQIIRDRTFVPLRFVSEFFGAFVSWDGDLRVVEIIGFREW